MASLVAVSLLRGINVGGHRKVRMDELKDLYQSLGLKDVTSYLQSGNVLFKSEETDLAAVAGQIEDGLARRFGFHADILIRSATELASIVARNPFQKQLDRDSKWLVVMFLAAAVTDQAQDDLLRAYGGPEELYVDGREVYIYYPSGIGRSQLSHSFLERKLKTVGTARNWNTVLQLLNLARTNRE